MSKQISIAVVMMVCACVAVSAAEPGPSKDIPELAVLKHWAGSWNARMEKPMRRTGTSHGTWVAGGRYFQQSWKVNADKENPEISGTWLMTYDVKENVYRQWQFNSDGFTAEASGKWNAETNAMTWTRHDGESGSTTINKDHFVKDGEHDWSIVITDRDGKTIFEMTGHNTRRR